MGEMADYLIDRMLDGPDLFWGDEDGDDVTCNRCGKSGLHWQKVFSADGERPVLFDSDNKRHVCEISVAGMSPE